MTKKLKIFLIFCSTLFLCLLGVVIYIVVVISELNLTKSFDFSEISNSNTQIKLYSHDKTLLSNSSNSSKITKFQDIPQHTIDAFISIEDKDFYQHKGLDIDRIVKATLNNLMSGYPKEGASTITQQLVKNTYLSNEKTIKRKLQEAYLASEIEKKFSKEEILLAYLNTIYFGNNIYGIENASWFYFSHSAKDLDLCESAILAGLIKAPNTYSPTANPSKSLFRRNLVLSQMFKDKKITQENYATSKDAPLLTSPNKTVNDTKWLIKEGQKLAQSQDAILNSNSEIYSYVNDSLQKDLANSIPQIANINNCSIILDNNTNNVIACIGSPYINRQAGSLLKPFLCYAPAFESGALYPATLINDEETTFGDYTPKNATGKYDGWVNCRKALAQSLNIPAVKALSYIGVETGIAMAKQFGFEFQDSDNHLAIALGATANGVTPFEIIKGYSALANMGILRDINTIEKIKNTHITITPSPLTPNKQVLSKGTTYIINDILQDCAKTGTAKVLNSLNLNLSAKTGTVGTNDGSNTDAWCISYNPQFTVLTWYGNITGNDEYNLSSNQNGGTIASRANLICWQLLENYTTLEKTNNTLNDEVQTLPIDTQSLAEHKVELATDKTPKRYIINELFLTKHLPPYSTNFTELITPTLNITKLDNAYQLNWQGKLQFNYEVYAVNNNQPVLLTTIKGANKIIYYDILLQDLYTEYFLIVKNKYNDALFNKSNTVVLYNNESNNLLPSKTKKWFFI